MICGVEPFSSVLDLVKCRRVKCDFVWHGSGQIIHLKEVIVGLGVGRDVGRSVGSDVGLSFWNGAWVPALDGSIS
jgi:hypothetical protein